MMALQPKPLRMLYRKYAAHAPKGDNTAGTQNQTGLLSGMKKSESLGNLHMLGREFSKLEKVRMFFDMSEDPYVCSSHDHSTVASASTNGRSSVSKKAAPKRTSPSRFFSRSQEFQNMYKLAASRASPERQGLSSSKASKSRSTHLPRLSQKGRARNQDSASSHSSLDDPRVVLQVRIDEKKPQVVEHRLKPLDGAKSPNLDVSADLRSSSVCSSEDQDDRANHMSAGQLQRSQTSSTVDTDRVDSSHYQYLFDDFMSLSSSEILRSVKSDPSSTQVSARAQRPSTSGTVCTIQRLRDLQTCTTGMTTPVTQLANVHHQQQLQAQLSRRTSKSKSPDPQWPPRYATHPSWPSLEDFQTMNSCGEHKEFMTRLYRQESDVVYGRRTRDRALRINFWNREMADSRKFLDATWNKQQNQKVHVVPSHTNMECAMCNLYKQQKISTVCPPNTPLVMSSHDFHDVDSHLSTNVSLHVHPSQASEQNSSRSPSKRHEHTSHSEHLRTPAILQAKKADDEGSVSKSQKARSSISRDLNNDKRMPPLQNSNAVHHGTKRKGVAYSWDTCKWTYVKANA